METMDDCRAVCILVIRKSKKDFAIPQVTADVTVSCYNETVS